MASGLFFAPLVPIQPVQAQTTSQGYILLNRGWIKDAIRAFQQTLQRNPQSLEAKLGLAIAYQRAGEDENAWSAYQRVLAQDPENRAALQAVGLLGSYRPQWQARGIAALTTLLQQTPNDLAARAQRALLYGYQGRYSEAIADYESVLQANPKPDTVLQAAQIYTYSGDYTQGLKLFERYRSQRKTIPDNAITAYATALRQTGQAAQAIQVLEPRLKQQPSNALAIELRTALATAYQANQQSDTALQVLAPLRGQPQAVLPLARALSEIGRQTRNAELYRESIGLYQQALQQTKEPSPGFVMEVADVLSEERSTWTDALNLYQQLSQQQPNNPSLLVKRSALEAQLGQISRTDLGQRLLSALQPLPTAASDRQLIAQAFVKLDPPEPLLLPVYQQLLQSGVNAPFLNFRIAQIQMQTGNLAGAKQALAAYSAGASRTQDFAPDLLLAEIERREGNLEGSAQRYEALIGRNPDRNTLSIALQALAGVRQTQGRLDDALQVYDQILSRDAGNRRAQLGRASLAYQMQRLSEAEAEAALNQWLQTQPASDAPPELLSLVGALPANPSREALYNRLLELEPTSIALQRRSLQVLALRDPEQARARLNQVVQQNPENITAYFMQGELAQAVGDLSLASRAYEMILQRQPQNVDALSALGGVWFEQKRYAEAVSIYRQVLALKPNDPEINRILAELSLVQDQPLSALQQFKQVQQSQNSTGAANSSTTARIERIRVDILKRRGFQPAWERY